MGGWGSSFMESRFGAMDCPLWILRSRSPRIPSSKGFTSRRWKFMGEVASSFGARNSEPQDKDVQFVLVSLEGVDDPEGAEKDDVEDGDEVESEAEGVEGGGGVEGGEHGSMFSSPRYIAVLEEEAMGAVEYSKGNSGKYQT